jgi:Tol biopolymer transport system component
MVAGFALAAPTLTAPKLAHAQSPQAPQPSSGSPEVSPDGKHIAFGSSRDGKRGVYVMDPDGGNVVAVGSAMDNAGLGGWTADGRVLLARRTNDSTTLFVANADGTGTPREIARAPGREAKLSPDGQSILSVTGPFRATVFVVSQVNGATTRPITDGRAIQFNAEWSPDGKEIAYSRLDSANNIGVWVMNADGSNAHAVADMSSAQVRAQLPAWSSDGRRLAIQGNALAPGDTSKHLAHIWVVDVATGGATRLASHDEPYLDETPSWFPDGQRIAFQSSRTGRMQVWVMNADGTGARQLTR